MILSGIDTHPTWEAMKRGEWPEPNPQVKDAWEKLARLDFGESEASEDTYDEKEGND